jgi:hypothetical protein
VQGDTPLELAAIIERFAFSFLLNAFAVPLPPGAAPMWAGA